MFSSWLHAASVLTAVGLLASACGGGSPQDPPSGDGGAVQIRGGERLGWVQAAPSEGAVRAYQFALFVDGIEAVMSDVRCGTPVATGYDCSGRLPSMSPGRHVLEVASSLNGQQSPRSSALTVMVLAGQQASITAESGGSRTGLGTAIACAGGTENCYDVSVVASGLTGVAALTTTADDRLLFIEQQRRVRVVEGDVLLAEPAYAVERATDRIVGIAADPASGRGNLVYVAWTETGTGGASSLNVSRFREVADVLGEGATIVTGLPFPDDASAPLWVDDDGLPYLALPTLAAADRGRSDAAFSGFVLRFGSDGGVPVTNPRASPVLAVGLNRPMGLRLDRLTRRMWMTGMDDTRNRTTVSFAIDLPPESTWPVRPQRTTVGSKDPFDIPEFSGLNFVLELVERPDKTLYALVRDGSDTTSILMMSPR